jgi:hypothetical protein
MRAQRWNSASLEELNELIAPPWLDSVRSNFYDHGDLSDEPKVV